MLLLRSAEDRAERDSLAPDSDSDRELVLLLLVVVGEEMPWASTRMNHPCLRTRNWLRITMFSSSLNGAPPRLQLLLVVETEVGTVAVAAVVSLSLLLSIASSRRDLDSPAYSSHSNRQTIENYFDLWLKNNKEGRREREFAQKSRRRKAEMIRVDNRRKLLLFLLTLFLLLLWAWEVG